MKIIATMLLLLIPLTINVPTTANAQTTEYAEIISTDTYLYSNQNLYETSRLFILEQTYYVKVLKKEETYYQVSYCFNDENYVPIIGYVNPSQVELKTPNSNIYNYNYKLDKISNAMLYTTTDLLNIETAILDSEVYYYGKYLTSSETLYFVQYSGFVGYVKSSCFSTFDAQFHPEYVPPVIPDEEDNEDVSTPPSDDTSTTVTGNPDSSMVEVMLIGAICIPAVIIIFLLFKSPKNRTKKYGDIYTREDYPPYDRDNFKD